MRWNRATDIERSDRLHKWHDWFAWYPVRLVTCKDNTIMDTNNIVWLENVKRKYHNHTKFHMSNEDCVIFQLHVDSFEDLQPVKTKKQ